MRGASDAGIRKICDVSGRVLRGKVPVSPAYLRKLRRYRKAMAKVAGAKDSPSRARGLLMRGGSFLPVLMKVLKNAGLGMLSGPLGAFGMVGEPLPGAPSLLDYMSTFPNDPPPR